MHLAEGMLPLGQAAGWTAAAVPVLLWSSRRATCPSRSRYVIGDDGGRNQLAVCRDASSVAGACGRSHQSHLLDAGLGLGGRGPSNHLADLFCVVVTSRVFCPRWSDHLGGEYADLGLLGPLCTVGLWQLLRKVGQTMRLDSRWHVVLAVWLFM